MKTITRLIISYRVVAVELLMKVAKRNHLALEAMKEKWIIVIATTHGKNE